MKLNVNKLKNRRLLYLILSAFALSLLLFQPIVRALTSPSTVRISVASDGTQSNGANGLSESSRRIISADDRYILFESYATNLVAGNPTNGTNSLYLHDTQTHQTSLVALGGTGGSISANGQFAVYAGKDINNFGGVFIKNLNTGVTDRIDKTLDGGVPNIGGNLAAISADGRYVVFQSGSPDLVPNDINSKVDIFVRDTMLNTTKLVSLSNNGSQANDLSTYSAISANGRYIAFESYATNLVDNDTNGKADLFLRDMQTGETIIITKSYDGGNANGLTSGPIGISDDGQQVAYSSLASNLVHGDLNNTVDVFVRNLQTDSTKIIGDPLGPGTTEPSISADGRYVGFISLDANYVSGDTNSRPDVFTFDQQTNMYERVSVASDGAQQNGSSLLAQISPDGRYVAFMSQGTNIIPNDTNNVEDIFLRDRGASDSTPPSITSSITPQPNSDGWNNSDVTVSFNCTDEDSGVATCPNSVLADQEGGGQIFTGTATDNAGNSSTTSVTLNIDKTTPTINYSVEPAANTNGWNNGDVVVTFNCNDALSGIKTCTSPVTLSTEGGNQTVTGTAVDLAGNTASITATLNIDKTNPTINYTVNPQPNSNGWNNTDTTITFTCNDALSGIATCPEPVTLTEGGGQIITGTATDNAGNSSSTSVLVNIDKTAPSVSNISWSSNPLLQGQNTTLSVSATDALSGVASVQYSVDGGASQQMTYNSSTNKWEAAFGSNLQAKTYMITITATDQAGNVSSGLNDVLAVYNSSNGYVTGHARIQPTTNDVLPIALDSSNNPKDLIIGFTNVTSPASGSFDMTYSVKNKQDEFDLSSTSINWVVVSDSTHASILGKADLTTWVNGAMSVKQNVTVRFDIVLGSNGNPDSIAVKIYNPGDDPNTTAAAYSINDTVVAFGSNLMIHP